MAGLTVVGRNPKRGRPQATEPVDLADAGLHKVTVWVRPLMAFAPPGTPSRVKPAVIPRVCSIARAVSGGRFACLMCLKLDTVRNGAAEARIFAG